MKIYCREEFEYPLDKYKGKKFWVKVILYPYSKSPDLVYARFFPTTTPNYYRICSIDCYCVEKDSQFTKAQLLHELNYNPNGILYRDDIELSTPVELLTDELLDDLIIPSERDNFDDFEQQLAEIAEVNLL